MYKQALVGEALDAYSDVQAKHPFATMGVGLAGSVVPGFNTAMELPNIAQELRHKRLLSAAGRTGAAALGVVPGLSATTRLFGPMASSMGGEYLQQRVDAKAASHGGYTMNKSAFLPALAAAAPSIGSALATGAASTVGAMGAQKLIEKATAPKPKSPEIAASAAPPPEPKLAFAQRVKTAREAIKKAEMSPEDVSNFSGSIPKGLGRLGVATAENALPLTGIGALGGVGLGAITGHPAHGAAIGAGAGLGGTLGGGLGSAGGFALARAIAAMRHMDPAQTAALGSAMGGYGLIGGGLAGAGLGGLKAHQAMNKESVHQRLFKLAAQPYLPGMEDTYAGLAKDKLSDLYGHVNPMAQGVKKRWDDIHSSVKDPLKAGLGSAGAAGIGAITGGATGHPLIGGLGGLASGVGGAMLGRRLGLSPAATMALGAGGASLGGLGAGMASNLAFGHPRDKESAWIPPHPMMLSRVMNSVRGAGRGAYNTMPERFQKSYR